jgi:hypothetical protein
VNETIIHIDLSSNDIGPDGAKVLFEVLETNCTLISLTLRSYEGLNRNRIGAKGVECLRHVLKKNKVL